MKISRLFRKPKPEILINPLMKYKLYLMTGRNANETLVMPTIATFENMDPRKSLI